MNTVTAKNPPRNRPEVSDVIGTAILGVVGAVAAVMGIGYGLSVDSGEVGPGLLPFLTGTFIFLASVAEIFRLFFARVGTSGGRIMSAVEDIEATAAESIDSASEAVSASGDDVDTFGRTEKQRNRAPFVIFATFGIALALVPVLGLIIALSLAILFLLIVVEKQKWWTSAAATIGAAVFVYIVFGLVLSVPMPTGMLGLI
ncbi:MULTISPECIES: tripartite tricarboxylate transporter TctB family protein [unclassified Brevibacterium]|uniref:tripartite tricarboxylate transporter TctB family protein n=1 Tax=unclassified Brevibacterium TaxID=2614124 RepID=UPI0010F58715|nr:MULTISPECIES: tripartite tricarboxylate transporter TctB family protein [unclassified Brevibacterium]MCM1013079.1 tripartite tricarboxylate transporter TctB family protein [Brevibacterium sp. XM4083]